MLKQLISFGLLEKEAKLYLALLELGPSSVSEVGRKTKITRTNCYHILNSLVTRGLVNLHEEKTKIIFSAENPERLIRLLQEEVKNWEDKLTGAQKLMPELKSIYSEPEGKLKVRYYEGVEGIISAYEDTLTSKETILGYASVEYQHTFFPGYFPEYYERRTKRGIPVKAILAYTKESFRVKSLDKKHIRVTRIVPKSFEISPEINIYDNKTAIMSLKEKFGVIIESREVADAFKKLFELAWEKAGQYDKGIGDKYRPEVEQKMILEKGKKELKKVQK